MAGIARAFAFRNGGDVDLGDHEDVDRRAGVDVAKGQHLVVFVDDVGGDFAIDDASENRRHVIGDRG